MNYRWKTVEVRTEKLEAKLNELQSAGFEVIKVDLLNWDINLRSGLYLILARQATGAPANAIPAVKYHIPMAPTGTDQ